MSVLCIILNSPLDENFDLHINVKFSRIYLQFFFITCNILTLNAIYDVEDKVNKLYKDP